MLKYILICVVLFNCYACEKGEKKSETAEKKVLIPHTKKKNLPKTPAFVSFCNTQINLTDLDIKERFERELIVNLNWHSNTILYFKRAKRWFPLISKILKENNIPNDFKYLALIESGLTQATSLAGAKGFWQFMKGTAKDYNLEISKSVDERLHVEKSTKAACQYLKSAFEKFNSWPLVAAAYNRGKNGIAKDLENQEVNNFFDLKLNNETARYFFRIIAVKYLLEHPSLFDYAFNEEDYYLPYKTKTVTVNKDILSLATWAKNKGFNLKIVKKLNPWLISDKLKVKHGKTYLILLPAEIEKLEPYK